MDVNSLKVVSHPRTGNTHFAEEGRSRSICGLFAFSTMHTPFTYTSAVSCNRCTALIEEKPVGRPSLYPWDLWMNGEVHTIQKGVDFDVSMQGMKQQMRNQTKEVDLRFRSFTVGSKITFRFFPPGEDYE